MGNHMRDSNSELNQVWKWGFAMEVTPGDTRAGEGQQEGATALLKKTVFTISRMSLLIILWIFGTFFGIYNKPYFPLVMRP